MLAERIFADEIEEVVQPDGAEKRTGTDLSERHVAYEWEADGCCIPDGSVAKRQ